MEYKCCIDHLGRPITQQDLEKSPLQWTTEGNLLYSRMYEDRNIKDVAAFDFDGTLIWSDRGKKYIDQPNEWVVNPGPLQSGNITSTSVPSFLTDLWVKGWSIVIFSNQKLFGTRPEVRIPRRRPGLDQVFGSRQMQREQLEKIKEKFQSFVDVLKFNPMIFIALADDQYRKPRPGMFERFKELTQSTPSEASFYCGDASGPADQNPLYRWSDDDSTFARNIGLEYYLPDEMFRDSGLGQSLGTGPGLRAGFHSVVPSIPEPQFETAIFNDPEVGFTGKTAPLSEVIVTIGQFGSGWEEYAEKLQKDRNYTIVDQSVLRMKPFALGFLTNADRLTITGEHPSALERMNIIKLINEANLERIKRGLPTLFIRWFWFTRPGRPFNDLLGQRKHSEAEMKSYSDHFVPIPLGDPGFEDVVRIN